MNIEKLHSITNKKILVFGDYMVDKYIIGDVNRISPEAPVPVIKVNSEQMKIGGAGNVVNNIVSLGAHVRMLGCIGDDIEGRFILNYFDNSLVDFDYLKVYRDVRTIIKTRVVSKKQQFLRIDKEDNESIPKEYEEYLINNIDSIFDGISVLVISDYNKGSVTSSIANLLIKKANELDIPIVVDPKGNNYEKYRGATVCTPNVNELSVVCNKKIVFEEDILKYGSELCEKINLKYLLLTRSEKGISLINCKSEKKDFPALAKDVIDVSGAGDTVVSTIAILLALDFDIEEICKIANIAASIVVSKFGTSTLSLNELICGMTETGEFKLVNKDTIKYIVNDLKDKNKKIVFTNGCFDLLHAGHLSSFIQAKKYGDILIVAVNSDASVKKNKGDLRPIINQDDRIAMLCALDIVDYVVLMEDTNPINLIELIQPDVCVKGSDWKDKVVPEKKIIESYGGRMEFIELSKDRSTTNIINKILKVYKNE